MLRLSQYKTSLMRPNVAHWTFDATTSAYFILNKIILKIFLSPGCDDSQTLPRLALRPHRILALLPAFWLPPRWLGGRPPPPPSRRSGHTCQNQGGAGRRSPQEEGEEGRVRAEAGGPAAGGPALRHGRVSPIPVPGNEVFFMFLPKEALAIKGACCTFFTGQ